MVATPGPFDYIKWGFKSTWWEPAGGVQRPLDVIPGANSKMQEMLDSNPMIPHWPYIWEHAQSRATPPPRELYEAEVGEMTTWAQHDVVIWAQHGQVIGTVCERILPAAADIEFTELCSLGVCVW